MANPTTNFGWVMPTSSSLVTNLPADFNTFGQAVDTSMSELLGGTTGQVLSKTSNTSMDFTWVTPADQTPLTTKGDLFTFTTVDARLAVGNNGETLVADSSTATGLRYQGDYAAGKNKIINGDMSVWQRGTTFNSAASGSFTADRYQIAWDSSPTVNASQQTFTPGTAPQAGYESAYFLRVAETATSASTVLDVRYRIEDVRTFAGQTSTLSFWAKADSARTLTLAGVAQNFGSGGSAGVDVTPTTSTFTLTTSWQRFSTTITFPSISGKTIGTGSNIAVFFRNAASATLVFDLWGVQWEQGLVATAFNTATATIQGELAACQRYYQRQGGDNVYQRVATGIARSATVISMVIQNPVTMRVNPTAIDYATLIAFDGTNFTGAVSAVSSTTPSKSMNEFEVTVTSATQYRPYQLLTNNTTAGYIGFTAEL